MSRPRTDHGILAATAFDAASINLLGGTVLHQVALSVDQTGNLGEFYGYHVDTDCDELTEAGNIRNLLRDTSNDGVRVMGFLSRYLGVDEHKDPVRFLQMVLTDAGYDVPDLPEDLP